MARVRSFLTRESSLSCPRIISVSCSVVQSCAWLCIQPLYSYAYRSLASGGILTACCLQVSPLAAATVVLTVVKRFPSSGQGLAPAPTFTRRISDESIAPRICPCPCGLGLAPRVRIAAYCFMVKVLYGYRQMSNSKCKSIVHADSKQSQNEFLDSRKASLP